MLRIGDVVATLAGKARFVLLAILTMTAFPTDRLHAENLAIDFCEDRSVELASEDYGKILRKLTQTIVISKHKGDIDYAELCAKRLVEFSIEANEAQWTDKISVLLLLTDVLKEGDDPHAAEEYYLMAASLFPESPSSSSAEIAMFSSSIADYLFSTRDMQAHDAYRSLIELAHCNSIIKSALPTYRKRMALSMEWSGRNGEGQNSKRDCPSIDYFSSLLD